MKAVKLKVSGLVQGVGFRYMTKILADRLGVVGIVRNMNDGSVYIEAQAPTQILYQFISAVKAGPSPSGKVDHVEITAIPVQNFTKFDVVYY
ncbi:acylphosphatase [Ligilactobacillus sp. WILCCON 0076]|uniref:acylphosphatase n=1 Tax=Ligilactobacillus ubinensis TaxID=2876789 RepID=A0A9X2JL02_9LACO|nr:acylphosphatase [Ligilactobacillus ubinensis]MCP0886439.1 acylphosphatase [Ligilactobacillus ubinensis]